MSVINTNQLKSALERLCLVVPKRATLPVLENLRWRAAKGHLELAELSQLGTSESLKCFGISRGYGKVFTTNSLYPTACRLVSGASFSSVIRGGGWLGNFNFSFSMSSLLSAEGCV